MMVAPLTANARIHGQGFRIRESINASSTRYQEADASMSARPHPEGARRRGCEMVEAECCACDHHGVTAALNQTSVAQPHQGLQRDYWVRCPAHDLVDWLERPLHAVCKADEMHEDLPFEAGACEGVDIGWSLIQGKALRVGGEWSTADRQRRPTCAPHGGRCYPRPMEKIDGPKEFGRAVIATIVAFLVGLFLKALGAGKWLAAGAGGAAGGMVALAVIA